MRPIKAIAVIGALLAFAAVAARAEVIGGASVRVSFNGWIAPEKLPRAGVAPVALHVRGALETVGGGDLPALRSVTIEINRHARISTAGLPTCRRGTLEARTTKQALRACRSALVGSGRFSADIHIPEGAPFPAEGRMLAFNATSGGRHVILAHIFGRDPVPTASVLTFAFERPSTGTFGTVMSIELPDLADDWGHLTGFEVELQRRYLAGGRERSLISANCPAPRGFSSAIFAAARGVYRLADGREITRLVSGTCHVARG